MAGALFALGSLVIYTVGGLILGGLAASSSDRRQLGRFALGAMVGLAGAMGVVVTLPGILDRLHKASTGQEVFDRGLLTMLVSLAVLASGAVIGRRIGATSNQGTAVNSRQSPSPTR
jgi:hypothetical protein